MRKGVSRRPAKILHDAAVTGGVRAIAALAKRGADVDAQDNSGTPPIFGGALTNNPAVVRELIGRGADVNARGPHKRTSAHMAAGVNARAVIGELAKRGANFNVRDVMGDTPLDCAEKTRAMESAVLLRKLGAKRGKKL